MKLNSNPENIAVMENVGEIGEFKIKNSAKAFSILSSGIYQNKIRAIIRELSCNAYDSHVEAGKKYEPFDVHLPTTLEPYFSIRDYGTGLTHQQVFDIYTTYFESTKTNSNDYVGALGLGSKSPFSYTDNFTITAIKDGKKGIYSAFINDHGFPSVVKMNISDTDEPDGVEVKFAVNDYYDYKKFIHESSDVFKDFAVIPNFTGASCNVIKKVYKEKNIIKNVHVLSDTYYNKSYAVMGNISYPIETSSIETHIDASLVAYLGMSLEIQFDIGDVDFQTSREGLSYTKHTISSIEAKLKELESKLDGIIAAEADKISNMWEKVDFLVKKSKTRIWKNSIVNYTKVNKIDFIESYYSECQHGHISISEKDLEEKYNIKMTQFKVDIYNKVAKNKNPDNIYCNATRKYISAYKLHFKTDTKFVYSEKTRGSLERAKYHFKNFEKTTYDTLIAVMHSADNSKPVDYEKFFNDIHNPLDRQIFKADDLEKKPVERNYSREKGASIIRLQEDYTNGRYNISYVWKDNINIDLDNQSKAYYYIPISGFSAIPQDGLPVVHNVKDFFDDIRNVGIMKELKTDHIYGVRKQDLELIESLPNWHNIQEIVKETLKKVARKTILKSLTSSDSDFINIVKYIKDSFPDDSEFAKMANNFEKSSGASSYISDLKKLMKEYNPDYEFDKMQTKIEQEYNDYLNKYPLLRYIRINYYDNDFKKQVINYISTIDKTGEK